MSLEYRLGDAAAKGHHRRVGEFLRNGAKVNSVDTVIGHSILMRAIVGSADPKVIRQLLAAGADPNICTKAGETALMMAIRLDRKIEVVHMLLDAGANVRAVDSNGYGALHYAIMSVSPAIGREPVEVARLLLEVGVDPNNGGCESITPPLALACMWGRKAISAALLEAGAEVPQHLREDGFWSLNLRQSQHASIRDNEIPIRRLVEAHVLSRSLLATMDSGAPADPVGESLRCL